MTLATTLHAKKNYSNNVAFEQFIDISTGRTILARRYNGSLWIKENVNKKFPKGITGNLKDCPVIVCNGEKFYLWYDCIPDHIFR